MLGVTVTYKDMEAEDLELYRSLLFLINNPVADLGYEVGAYPLPLLFENLCLDNVFDGFRAIRKNGNDRSEGERKKHPCYGLKQIQGVSFHLFIQIET